MYNKNICSIQLQFQISMFGNTDIVLTYMITPLATDAPPLSRPYSIDQNIFAQFITFQDSKIMTRKFSFVDDGRTKPKPRKERGGASQEPTEHKCLIRAQLGSKKITTVVSVLSPV